MALDDPEEEQLIGLRLRGRPSPTHSIRQVFYDKKKKAEFLLGLVASLFFISVISIISIISVSRFLFLVVIDPRLTMSMTRFDPLIGL